MRKWEGTHTFTLLYLQPEYGVNGQVGEVILVLGQDFGAQGGAGNVHQVLTEFLGIFPVNTYINPQVFH